MGIGAPLKKYAYRSGHSSVEPSVIVKVNRHANSRLVLGNVQNHPQFNVRSPREESLTDSFSPASSPSEHRPDNHSDRRGSPSPAVHMEAGAQSIRRKPQTHGGETAE